MQKLDNKNKIFQKYHLIIQQFQDHSCWNYKEK